MIVDVFEVEVGNTYSKQKIDELLSFCFCFNEWILHGFDVIVKQLHE